MDVWRIDKKGGKEGRKKSKGCKEEEEEGGSKEDEGSKERRKERKRFVKKEGTRLRTTVQYGEEDIYVDMSRVVHRWVRNMWI